MSQDKFASYGRGGAGNIAPENPQAQTAQSDLVTPTLKSEHYTTGRGGSGNMARNDPNHPEVARAAQDVNAPPHRDVDGPHHFGRGGAANVAKGSPEPEGELRKSGDAQRQGSGSNEGKGLVEKGKDLLHKLGGKK